jgi:EmrB/QacA subfamily drug resistance transporter
MTLPTAGPAPQTGDQSRSTPLTSPALVAAVLGFFVVTLDAVIVNVALPSVRADLGGGVAGLQWVVDGYTLTFAALLLTAGSLGDRLGARRAFGIGMTVFVIASVACGLAPSLPWLVAARVAQGAAAAMMMPSSMALIRQTFPEPRQRARAVGVWAMGGALASTSAPLLGGLLSTVGWRLIFLVNVPVGAVALGALLRSERSPRRTSPIDVAGQVTAVLAMGGLAYGAIEAGALGVTAAPVVAAFFVAVVATALFVVVERRVHHPMVPLELFRNRPVSISLAAGFAFMVGYYGLPFVVSLLLQQERGFTPLATGLVFLPMMVAGAALTPFSARAAERWGRRAMLASGLALMAVDLVVVGLAAPTAPAWLLGLLMVPLGVGGPLVSPTATAVLLDAVPGRSVGTASGVFNTSRQLGGALAIAVFGGLLAVPGSFVAGARISLVLGALVLAAAAMTSLRLARHRLPPAGPQERP